MKEFFNRIRGIFYGDGEEKRDFKTSLKKALTTDIAAKLMCVFAAICIWFYVIDAESPTYEDTFNGVEIEFSTNLRGFEILSSERNTVEVVLSGKRSEINRMNSSDIRATVDISHITEAGEYALDIDVTTSNESSVESITPKSIYVYLDKSSSRSVMVRADYTGGTSDDKLLKIGELEPSKNFITVYGPEEALSEIEVAEVTVDLNLISHSVNITNKPLKLLDSDGIEIDNKYIRLGDSTVDVYVPVYMEKELPVVPQLMYGYFDSEHLTFNASPATVTVRGEIEDVELLDGIMTDPIDETTIGFSRTLQTAYDLPDGVSLIGARGKCSVNIGIKNYSEKQITVSSRRIDVSNAPDGFAASATESMIVTVCGSSDVVSDVNAMDIKAICFADGLSEGVYYDVPVEVAFGSDEMTNVFIRDAQYTTTLNVQPLQNDLEDE